MKNDFLLFHKPFISEEEVDEIVDTVRSGWISMGPKTIRFENNFNEYIGAKKSVAVSSWTAAGHLSLEAFGIKEGDEVVAIGMKGLDGFRSEMGLSLAGPRHFGFDIDYVPIEELMAGR